MTNGDALKQVLEPACDATGVQRFGWNGLRRAYAKSMISGGHTKDVVRKKLGDSRGSNTLEKYYYNLEHSEVLGQEFVVDYD